MFTYGSTKYHSGASTNVKTSTKTNNNFSRPPPLDNLTKANKTIIAYGDGAFSPSMRGKRSGPTKAIVKAIQKCSVAVVMTDEYLTSQVCNKCKQRNVENVTQKTSKRRVHSVLQCQESTCNVIWNRDVMAANNILDIFLHAAANNDTRLSPFRRSEAKK